MGDDFDWGKYKTIDQNSGKAPDSRDFDWNSYQPYQEESTISKVGRYLYQPVAGVLSKLTYPMNLLQMASQGEVIAEYNDLEERIPELQKMFPNAPWENFKGLDKEKYMQAVQDAGDFFPTQQNIERGIENLTGLPLTPQNEAQQLMRLGGTAGAFRPGNLAQKTTAAVVAPAIKTGLDAAGVPEPLSETAALLGSALTPTPSFSKTTKPSGLTTRNFENVKKPTTVTPSRYGKITEAVESDFKNIADKLLDESSMTYRAMKENPNFKNDIGNLFTEVKELSKNVEGNVSAQRLKDTFRNKINSREKVGITPDEFERSYLRESKKLYKEMPNFESINAEQIVDQFRKNNRSLSEIFESGKSKAFNRAKAEALLDYNRSLEELVNQKYGDTEFSKLFKSTNKRWSEIKDIESVKQFMDEMFEGKIQYAKGNKFFERHRVAEPFKRTLGPENFKKFEGLMDDLMSTENAMKLIRKAEQGGFKDAAKLAGSFLVHPSLAKAKIAIDFGKQSMQMLLDKPKLTITWKSAIDEMKNGNYKKAESLFKELNSKLKVQNGRIVEKAPN